MKHIAVASVLLFAAPALAQEAQKQPDPAILALGQMAQQCSGREAEALSRAYALQAQIKGLQERVEAQTKQAVQTEASLKEQVAVQTKRADEAEAKLPKAEAPK